MSRVDLDGIVESLARADMLRGLGRDKLVGLAERCVVRRHRKGDHLAWQGDPSGAVFVILAGQVAVERIDPSRDVPVLIAVRGAGDLVGELSALEDRPRSADLRALTAVEAAVIDGRDFVRTIVADPDAALSVARALANRLREAAEDRIALNQKIEARLARALLQVPRSRLADGTWALDTALTQADLAIRSSATREHVNRTLRLFRVRRLYAVGRDGRQRLPDVSALERLAETEAV